MAKPGALVALQVAQRGYTAAVTARIGEGPIGIARVPLPPPGRSRAGAMRG